MTAFLESMWLPFLACLVLAGIHVYLGIHVLSRKVIFVDLALAQVAALGSVWGVLLGWDLARDPWQVKLFSLAFTFVGAAVFSLTRMRNERVPHEALIGITYAVALGATILASSHLAHGAEEVSELLAGSILWVGAGQVAVTALLYAAIGAFHWRFRRQFFLISLHPEQAEAEGLSVRGWDFLFYVSFGFVVTSSVSIAGVLLVFSYLVIPAVVAILFVDGVKARLLVGWGVGAAVSLIGCSLSYEADLPSGPTIVACFGACLVLAGIVHYLVAAPQRAAALGRVAAGALALSVLVGGSFLFRKRDEHDVVHLLEAGSKAEKMLALAEVEADPALWDRIRPLAPQLLKGTETEVRTRLLDLVEQRRDLSLLGEVHALLGDASDAVRDRALRCIKALASPESIGPLLAAAQSEQDEYLKVEMAEALLELGDRRGFGPLIDVIADGEAAQAKRDAWEHLRAHAQVDAPAGADEGAALRRWWAENETRLVPDPSGVFRTGP